MGDKGTYSIKPSGQHSDTLTNMNHPGFFESSQACHPEACRAEGPEDNARTESVLGSFGPAGLRMTGLL
jgi:hypothetical protein